MAYQNTNIPRFYCDIPQLIKTLGISSTAGGQIPEFWQTNSPSSQTVITSTWDADYTRWGTLETSFPLELITGKTFIAILGHNFADLTAGVKIKVFSAGAVSEGFGENLTSVVNEASMTNPPEHNGFSIHTMDRTYTGSTCEKLSLGFKTSDATIDVGTEFTAKFGQLLFGTYFDLPHSLDLKITMTREMDGVRKKRTSGGVDLVDYKYTKPAMWSGNVGADAGAWELYSGNPSGHKLSRVGRRIWDLSFSFLSQSSIFLDNPNETSSSGWQIENDTTPDFTTEVLKKTQGSMLPFIFQPDNKNPEFAICKFDQSSFSFQQQSPSLYSFRAKIREIW